MVQVIRSPVHEVVTKQGEVTIHLDITLNINTGGVQVSASTPSSKEEKDDDAVKWAIPSFKTEKIKFGKKVD